MVISLGTEDKRQVSFSLRVEADQWALFTAIATLKKTSAVELLRKYVDGYVEEHKSLINLEELAKSQK
jgi:hypothetical protein